MKLIAIDRQCPLSKVLKDELQNVVHDWLDGIEGLRSLSLGALLDKL
jgi:hypothetical protein